MSLFPCFTRLGSIDKLIDAIKRNRRDILTDRGHKGLANRWQESSTLSLLFSSSLLSRLLGLSLLYGASLPPNLGSNHCLIRL